MFDCNRFHDYSSKTSNKYALAMDSYCVGLVSKPGLHGYWIIICEYSSRKLTNEDVVLNSLSGTLTSLNFKGGFILDHLK